MAVRERDRGTPCRPCPKLRQAVRDAKKAGCAYVILDGTLIPVDRVAADRPFYSGKHEKHGMNLQVIASPDGDVLWVSGAMPGSVHDKKARWIWGVLDELEKVGLVTLADKGYQGSTWAKIPYKGKNKPDPQKEANRAHAKLDRTRSRLDIPAARAIFGPKNRPHRSRASGPSAQEVVTGKPQYSLARFRIRFGMLQVKAYTKDEHVLRFEATVHNARELRCRRGLDNLGEIITRLAGIADRFAAVLDCADISLIPDGILDELPLLSAAGAARTADIDLNKPRIRAALAAAARHASASRSFSHDHRYLRSRACIRCGPSCPASSASSQQFARVPRDSAFT